MKSKYYSLLIKGINFLKRGSSGYKCRLSSTTRKSLESKSIQSYSLNIYTGSEKKKKLRMTVKRIDENMYEKCEICVHI